MVHEHSWSNLYITVQCVSQVYIIHDCSHDTFYWRGEHVMYAHIQLWYTYVFVCVFAFAPTDSASQSAMNAAGAFWCAYRAQNRWRDFRICLVAAASVAVAVSALAAVMVRLEWITNQVAQSQTHARCDRKRHNAIVYANLDAHEHSHYSLIVVFVFVRVLFVCVCANPSKRHPPIAVVTCCCVIHFDSNPPNRRRAQFIFTQCGRSALWLFIRHALHVFESNCKSHCVGLNNLHESFPRNPISVYKETQSPTKVVQS